MLAMTHPITLSSYKPASCTSALLGPAELNGALEVHMEGRHMVKLYLVKLKHAQDSVAWQGQDQLVGQRGLIPGIIDCGVGPQDVLLLITPKLPA